MKKSTLSRIVITSCICVMASFSTIVGAKTLNKTCEPNENKEYEVKKGSYYANCEYDYGTRLPNDDACMSCAAKSPKGKQSSVYAYLTKGNKSDAGRRSGTNGNKYKYVAEIGGVDQCDYAFGSAISSVGAVTLECEY